METRFTGLAGFYFHVFANEEGIGTATPKWKSASWSGNSVTPSLPLFINEPTHITVAPDVPTVSNEEVCVV